MTGTLYSVSTSAADIVGFDPARDKLDLGDVTVHNFIVVDTPEGVGFMNPWSGEMQVVVGVSLGQLTVDSFAPIVNDHLRQDLSAALAWEQGIAPAAHTVYARSHEIGQIDRVAFDPATDVVDFRYFGTREQVYMVDSAAGVVISNNGTGQALVLLDVTLDELSIDNFVFRAAQVREDRVHLQLGFDTVPASQVLVSDGIPVAGTNAWPTLAGNGAPPSGESGTTYAIEWHYGATSHIAFDPAVDKLDFGWFKAPEFAVTEVGGSVVISITGNNQSYILDGVSLAELQISNVVTLDTSARAEWQGLIDGAASGGVPGGGDLPALSVADASVTEGNDGAAMLMFTVSLSRAATSAVTVDYSTANGSAMAGSDYLATLGTLTFAPGETSKMVHVSLVGDSIAEARENFTLRLSSPAGATLADGSATGTIIDDDPAPATPPTLTIGDATVAEGDDGEPHMMFTVSLSYAAAGSVTVRYATADGTALAGSDYEAMSGTLTFAPGQTMQMVHVPLIGDRVVEANETFTIALSGPVGATLADGIATGSITNDDAAVPVAGGADVDFSIANDWGQGFIGAMTVEAGDAALNGWTVAFDASFAITNIWNAVIISHVGNHYVIGNASWNGKVAADGATGFGFQATPGAGGKTATGFTLNGLPVGEAAPEPQPLPTLSVGDATVVEGNSGSSILMFTVTLSAAASTAVSVAYATGNGTATAGSDYTAVTGTLTFAPGETSKMVHVTVAGDKAVEVSETLSLLLSAPSGATIADGSGTGTIVNDDVAAPAPTLSIADASFGEGAAGSPGQGLFTVTLSAASATAVTVKYTTANGSATAGSDYTALSGTLTFAPGETSKTIAVKAIGDSAVEGNETFTVTLSSPSGATIADGSATGTLVNDDAPPPTLSIADARFSEGAAGAAGKGLFTVTLSAASDSAVTVKYAAASGTARAGSDFTSQSGTLTFAPGETSKTITIKAIGDSLVEADESFTVTLSSPSGATIADGSAVGTIVNDDAAVPLPTLSIADASFNEGAAGSPGQGLFTVTLSAASTSAVTVSYATANGTATAGSDYSARSGTLTFAPGETSKTIAISAIGDNSVEGNETFTVTLSSPSGATLADGSATGTLVNDDVARVPTLTIADATVVEGNPGEGAAAAGWLSTAGNQIVDAAGNAVQIAGVNWFGFESETMSPHGLWARSYTDMMDQMVELGFNTIRLPFSSAMLHSNATPGGINLALNPELAGLSALEIMDKVVEYAGEIGLHIILDHHRSSAGAGTSSNGLWYDGQYSEAAWIDDWQMLAARYADNPAVIGADLHNEPYNGTWGDGGVNDWAQAATEAGNAIGEVNPNWLIFVEGIATYQGENYWWGGNLMGVRDHPIDLAVDNKLVYSAHDYPNSVYAQPWFQGQDFAEDLPAKFDEMWGYIYREGIAPVYIGEFGTKLQDPKDAPWLEAITSYLSGDFDNDGVSDLDAGDQGVSWTYWSWNPNSGDTGGILTDDWSGVNANKLAYLQSILFDFDSDVPGGEGSGGEVPSPYALFTVSLSEAATESVTVDFHTVPGTADAEDFTAVTGSVAFAPGETSKTIAIEITPDRIGESDEMFSVVLDNPRGATILRGTATGSITNDDGTPGSGNGSTDPGSGHPDVTDDDLVLSFDLVNSWGSGFNGAVTVENDGDAAVHGWQIEIDMPYEITDIWNAEIVSHHGTEYVIRNAAWNGDIAADGEASFGFIGTGAGNPNSIDFLV